jgi:hypothetical protein
VSLQLSLDAREGTTELRIYVDRLERDDPGLGWKLLVRRGDLVKFELVENTGGGGGFPSPVPDEFDFVVDGMDEGRARSVSGPATRATGCSIRCAGRWARSSCDIR